MAKPKDNEVVRSNPGDSDVSVETTTERTPAVTELPDGTVITTY